MANILEIMSATFPPGNVGSGLPGSDSEWQITISLRDDNGAVVQAQQVSTQPEKINAFFQQLTSARLQNGGSLVAVLEICGFNDGQIREANVMTWFIPTLLGWMLRHIKSCNASFASRASKSERNHR